MRFLEIILDWFKAPLAANREAAWEPAVIPVDQDAVDRDLGISKAAQRWGAANLPRPESAEPDAGEMRIQAYFSELVRVLHGRVTKRLGQYRQTFSSEDPYSLLQEIQQFPARFHGDADAQFANHQLSVESLNREIAQAESDLAAFQAKQKISREPNGPQSHFGYVMFPIILLALDLGLNTFAFAPANEGLRGGLLVAAIVAGVNVIVAAILGYWARYVNRQEILLRVLGIACLLAVILLIPFNLVVAHYRDLSLSLLDISGMSLEEAQQRARSALEIAQTAVFRGEAHLTTPQSWGLFILGSIFAIASAIDGYNFADRVPGYDDLFGRVSQLYSERLLNGKRFNDAMVQLRLSAAEKLNGLTSQIRAAKERNAVRRELSMAAVNVYRQQVAIYQTAYAALATKYRQENQLHRSDGQIPVCFSQSLRELEIPDLSYDSAGEDANVEAFADIETKVPAALTAAQLDIDSYWRKTSGQPVGDKECAKEASL